MWLAKDLDGTIMAYENIPKYNGNTWYVSAGWYFDIPDDIVYELLVRNLKNEETISVELRLN